MQPKTNGQLIDEATACADLTKAETSARSMLSCPAAKHACPDYIHPAGGADCFKYDEGSVTECGKLFGAFTNCDDFEKDPCIVTVSQCTSGDTGEAAWGAPTRKAAALGWWT